MSNPHPSPGSRPLEQLKVAELREELRKRGLSLKGVKKDLFERLDEAVQREQSGLLLSAEEEHHKDAYGMYEPEGEHGINHSAGQLSENVQDGDALPYLNDTENPSKDSALIVNNASPYVGASDASSVFIEPGKDEKEMHTGFVASEQSKDDVPSINDVNSVSSGALPESVNAEAGDVGRSDNIMLESNAFFSGDDKPTAEIAASVSEPDEQCRGNEANLPAKEANDGVLLEDTLQASGNDAVLPELTSQADGNDGLLAAPELKSMNDIVSVDDGMIGETFALLQKPEAAEVTCQDDVAIPSEPVKLASTASVSDDLLPVADAASLPSSSFVGIANDSTAQEAEIIEKTALSSVNAVSGVLEPVKDSGGKDESVEDTIFKVKTPEDTNQVELLESGEALIPPSADREAPVMPLGAATLDVVQDLVLLEVQQDMAVPDSLQDSVMHEVVQDVVVQEVAQDVEMVEALKSPSMKVELPETVLETKLPAVSIDTLDYSVGVKPENPGSLYADNSNQLNEAVIGMVDELKPAVKLEPAEAESKAEGGLAPVEIVNAERQDVKEELPKSMRSYDRSRPRERESERSRHELGRASAYGDDRTRAEGRSGRVFREDRRKDPKEKEMKPAEEEFPNHNSLKRKDDDRDTKQQEPAKRARRWNSGAELAVETTKPTGSLKEIVSPELNKEGFAVAPPRPTPKLSGPSRPTPAPAKTNSEANGDKRAVPPPARAPTSSLKVERFVRPFTLKAVKDLLSEYGECVDFWMDQIKTHCYVMYSKVDEAVAARNGLYHKQWPPSFGNLLVADFVDPGDVKIRSDGTFEKMNTPAATTPRGVPNQPPQVAQLSGPFHGHSNPLVFAPPLRERQVTQVPVKEPEPPVPTLDDLFRKTKAKPHIYYLPLTDEQAAEKLASARDKEQPQARSRVPRRV